MSRHIVTVSKASKVDDEAVIGYDAPLRTYFLQAFPHFETDEPELWLGTLLETYQSLESLIAAARAQGYEVSSLDQKTIVALVEEAAQPSPPSIAEQWGIVR